jgi:hypothetical protein
VAGLLGDDVRHVGIRGVGGQGIPELAGQARRDLDPALAPVVGPVHAAVVLLVEPIRAGGVEQEPVDALAGLRKPVGKEIRADAPVARLPGRAAVIGAVHAAGR